MLAISIDIGASFIKYALMRESGEILNEGHIASEAKSNRESILNKLRSIINELIRIAVHKGLTVKGVAIGTPGIVDPKRNFLVNNSPNFADWAQIDFNQEIADKIKLPLYLDNDANMAALGELHFASSDLPDSAIVCTFGTGIGTALILRNCIHRGSAYIAGESGHMSIHSTGQKCYCGNTGCWERYASASALKRRFLEEFSVRKNIQQIFTILFSEDASFHEREFRDSYFNDIAIGLQNLIYILNPSLILLGGGAVESHDKFVDYVQLAVKRRISDYAYQNTLIRKAKLGNKAALYGGTWLVFND